MTTRKYNIKEEKDTCGDVGFGNLFRNYSVLSLEEFREYCIETIRKSRSPDSKKVQWVNMIKDLPNKDLIVKKVSNFMLAGEGLRV